MLDIVAKCVHGRSQALLLHKHHCSTNSFSQPDTAIQRQIACVPLQYNLQRHCAIQLAYLIFSEVSLATLLSPPDNLTKACHKRSSSYWSKLLICLCNALISVVCGVLTRRGDNTSCNTCKAQHSVNSSLDALTSLTVVFAFVPESDLLCHSPCQVG